jgi:hypothetical protein
MTSLSRNSNLATAGRYVFAVAILAFGVMACTSLIGPGTTALGPPLGIASHLWLGVVGVLLLLGGAGIAANKKVWMAAALLAVVMIARFLIIFVPALIANLRDPGPWTSGLELLAIAGAALVLASRRGITSDTARSSRSGATLSKVGCVLFAIALVGFGVQHFQYAKFVATLVPSWIPGHLFWAYFAGGAFVAAAIAIVTGIQARLGTTLLGILFLLFVITLHIPRTLAATHNGNEWTSLFIALAMSGASLIVAGLDRKS